MPEACKQIRSQSKGAENLRSNFGVSENIISWYILHFSSKPLKAGILKSFHDSGTFGSEELSSEQPERVINRETFFPAQR
jgi:hypothetical protein